jgi:tocopherol O-methyltransferase
MSDREALPAQIDSVIRYYESTRSDYENLWFVGNDPAVHFGYYDEEASCHAEAIVRMNAVLAGRAGIGAGDRVLDAGCGCGASAIWLASTIGCSVTGINVVPFQLAEAREYAARAGVSDRARFERQDYARLSFPDRSFTVYWGLESIVHSQDREAVLGEASRVLEPGGRILIAEYTLRENPPLDAREKAFLDPWLESWAMPRLVTPGEYGALLARAGFTNVRADDISPYVARSLRRLRKMCRIALPVAMLLRALRAFNFDEERVGNIRGSLRQVRAFEKGYWRYTLVSGQKAPGGRGAAFDRGLR